MSERITLDAENVGTVVPEIPHRLTFKQSEITPELWSRGLRWCEANTRGRWGAYVETLFSLITTDMRFEAAEDAAAFAKEFPTEPLPDTPDRKSEFQAMMNGIGMGSDQGENLRILFNHRRDERTQHGIRISLGKKSI